MKSEVNKLDINNLTNAPTSLTNWKKEVDDSDVNKLKTVDLEKLSDVIDNKVVKNTKLNTLKTKVSNLENKIPDETTLIHIYQYKADKQSLENKIGEIVKKYSIWVL